MKTVLFLPEAEEDMYEAARYYESNSLGLGIDFISEIERATESISVSPMAWPKIEGELR